MKTISKEMAEVAIKDYQRAKIQEAEVKGKIRDAEEIIEAYSKNHIEEFTDGRITMQNGIIAIKAGTAKPIKEGKPLSTAARTELATALPPAYVKMTCDFSILFDCKDKTVRQLLKSRGVEIVRDDKFTVI